MSLTAPLTQKTASVTCQPSRVSETPVRLFKHQIETKANKAPKAEPSKQQVSQLILSVVSECKHRGGISMAELKQTLAAQGYDVAKNNRRVKVVTERLVKDETLERTTRNTSFRLSNKVKPQSGPFDVIRSFTACRIHCLHASCLDSFQYIDSVSKVFSNVCIFFRAAKRVQNVKKPEVAAEKQPKKGKGLNLNHCV
uniref:H15 domain-containing protein n=1 Tax=Fundulus heteroclitus TaxID=8078 RepID=A0A3Q2QP66_FUNHE